jgi:hypothetical protein
MTVVTIRDGCAGDGPEARRRDVPYAGRRVRKGEGVLAELKHYLSRPESRSPFAARDWPGLSAAEPLRHHTGRPLWLRVFGH